MHEDRDPPGHPLGDGPGGVGPGLPGAAQVSGAFDGQVSPFASQHGGVTLSSSGHLLSSSN